ncbi:hypothetical protein EGM51_12870 [Verrucomicrobia bacterium S94]|nr:hypothetical protein EGM51_12870 [Verrucomicrobia bacterium S94]
MERKPRIEFERAGNLNTRIDVAGALTEYRYDALNRLTAITNQGVEVAAFDHDANGKRPRMPHAPSAMMK